MAQPSYEERFWAKVEKTDTCWNWTGYKDPKGYGKTTPRFGARDVHRIAYQEKVATIPAGMVIDHICHNPSCVRPEHLRVVTRKQNGENRLGAQCNSTSGIRGVSWSKRDRRWTSRVYHNGKHVYFGYFTNLEDAEAAVIAGRNELFTHNDLDHVTV